MPLTMDAPRPLTCCNYEALTDNSCDNPTAHAISFEMRSIRSRTASVMTVFCCAEHKNHVETKIRLTSRHVRVKPWNDDLWR